jgi:pimeloyl-ACP methyl ester carboxylesterase
MATFLLVHGAWHGAWCRERLEPLLRQAGHQTLAPDLLGMGNDPTALRAVSVEGLPEFAPGPQEIMYSEAPCRCVLKISSDHPPFYSAPRELAACLLDLAADVAVPLRVEA